MAAQRAPVANGKDGSAYRAPHTTGMVSAMMKGAEAGGAPDVRPPGGVRSPPGSATAVRAPRRAAGTAPIGGGRPRRSADGSKAAARANRTKVDAAALNFRAPGPARRVLPGAAAANPGAAAAADPGATPVPAGAPPPGLGSA